MEVVYVLSIKLAKIHTSYIITLPLHITPHQLHYLHLMEHGAYGSDSDEGKQGYWAATAKKTS